jgi:hypothetical protein
MPKKPTLQNHTSSVDLVRLSIASHRPGVNLAENVGRFETPFEYLKSARGGFGDTRFLLDKALSGDAAAIAVREEIAATMRHRRLNQPFLGTGTLEREYLTAHEREFMAYRREHYPWMFASEWAGADIHEPDPNTDVLLDHHICGELAEYGFTTKMRKCKKNYWRCHSSLLSRRMTIEFDKGRLGTNVSGEIRIDDIGYSVSLADPFFFSGCVFYASKVQQLPLQMERFFLEYVRIVPHVVVALEMAITAADDVLATAARRSVS